MCFILKVNLMTSIVYDNVIFATCFFKAIYIGIVEMTEMIIQFKKKYIKMLEIGFSYKQNNLTSNINIKQVYYITIESTKRKAIKLGVAT